MKRGLRTGVVTAAILLYVAAVHDAAQTPTPPPDSPQHALISKYCMGCHSDRIKSGGLALSRLDLEAPDQSAEIAEKVIRKLRGGLMPPAGNRRPSAQEAAGFVAWLEHGVDAKAVAPRPGRVPLRRLNRREYENAIRDLLGLHIDAKAWLPDDNIKGHFDNNAEVLQVSPSFVDQYINAARAVALEAIGDPKAPAETTTYGDVANMVISLPPRGADGTGRQQHHIEGMPFGTRGGFIVEHNFPADGEYELTIGDMALAREVPRMEFENTVIALLDGKEFYRTNIGGEADHKDIDQHLDPAVEKINGRLRKIRFKATAGQHKLAITFLQRSFAESDERIRTVALEGGQERIQAAHALQIRGPLSVTGVSRSASRAKIFVCQPSGRSSPEIVASEGRCAQQIVRTLARHAFRRPVTDDDVAPLMAFYRSGRKEGSFDDGVREALSAVLASPDFLYRVESADAGSGPRRLTDLELASRLSFFFWSSIPDDELLTLAAQSRLSKPDVLAAQVSRMLADPRAESLSEDFAFQWLRLSRLDEITPDRAEFPYAAGLYDPRPMFKEELRLFVDSVLRGDRSVMDLLTANYTFLNERLAEHYGIENVKGSQFRRVTLTDKARYGLLGKGAILMLTAYPNRTSPVLRGQWILDRLLGTPPADPPKNVPKLPENRRGQPAKTMRARMEEHRKNPTCFACHGVMDPLGFTLENFNTVGQYHAEDPDTRTPVDASGQLPDGTPVNGPEELLRALAARPDHQFVQAFTENLLTYALGRSLDYRDMPTVRRIVRESAADNFRFKSIVMGVVSSPAFRMRDGDSHDQASVQTAATRPGGN